ncbi:MAG: Gfo/Idh/MocA family oxidoreductase [Fibrobacter sp.]|nr:Gfo/Idh/MocA family oxidoreductase [Fibrobacter sp.]
MKKKVIVCGSAFGQFYIRALQAMPEKFELVGLFAKGSARSQKCAETYGIPLYTEFEKIPPVDLACVILSSRSIGGLGTEYAVRFMEKGVNVIHEQPNHPKDLATCLRVAKKTGTYFKTSDLYLKLPEVARFIRIARELNRINPPLYVKAAFSPQVAFPAMDILTSALPAVHSVIFENTIKKVGPFDIMTGKLGGIPTVMEYHNQVNPEDRDNYAHLFHNFAFVYESGRLTLEDTFGPVLWKPRMHAPKSLYNPEERDNLPDYIQENSIEILGDFKPRHFDRILLGDWEKSIAETLLEFIGMVERKDDQTAKVQRELIYSKLWADLTNAFGFAEVIHPDGHHYIPSRKIKNFSGEF